MDEIVFDVQSVEPSGALIAFWDDPRGGGITTQGSDLWDLARAVRGAVAAHFDPPAAPSKIRLRFLQDLVLVSL
ncbi:MAG: hypothetical protein GC160_01660 [Acidobacteria bacterium]|nr:hypothetical protein [Acidobacteriota bacterium]